MSANSAVAREAGSTPLRVVAAMSGGVDSAVAAARAVDAGWDVTGVHLALATKRPALRSTSAGCCSVEDSNDARRVADILGIPFYVWDFAERFEQDVVADFVAEYQAGRTPNPCLRCNEKIKFAALLDRATALGFDAVVTGHYAQLVDGSLSRAVDHGKDQSYVLAVLTPQQLAHAQFPLGASTKNEVRVEAARRGLAVADKPDSHDICFIPDRDTQGFLADRLGQRPGEIRDHATGAVLGTHAGTFGFTVGQRKGLNIGRPTETGRARYVLSLEPVTNTVVVGDAEQLLVDVVECGQPVWTEHGGPGAFAEVVDGVTSFDCQVQLRAHGLVGDATVTVAPDGLIADLVTPQGGIAAGQALVMYLGDRVLGSATISSTRRSAVSL